MDFPVVLSDEVADNMEKYKKSILGQDTAYSICTLLSTYPYADRTEALQELLNWDFQPSHYHLTSNSLKFLALGDKQLLQKYARKIVEAPNFNIFINVLLHNPDMQSRFAGTALDYDTIISSLFTHYNKDKNPTIPGSIADALAEFFIYGSDFHEKYKQNIINVISHMLNIQDGSFSLFFLLKNRLCPIDIQKKTLKVLMTYALNPHNNDHIDIIKGILEKSIMPNKRLEMYHHMDKICQKIENSLPLLFLWNHLRYKYKYDKFVLSSLMQYYNVTTKHIDIHKAIGQSLNKNVNKILEIALKHKTVSLQKFHLSLLAAQKTELIKTDISKFFKQQRKSIIFDETAPLHLRTLYVHNFFMSCFTRYSTPDFTKKISDFYIEIKSTLPPTSELRAYIENVYNIVAKKLQTSFKICAAKRALMDFHKKHHLDESLPEVVIEISGPLPNFLRFYKNPDRIFVDHELMGPYRTKDNVIYGILRKDKTDESIVEDIRHYLYACDAKTGYALWKMRLFVESKIKSDIPPYIITDEHVYVVNSGASSFPKKASIDVLDKKTGLRKNRFLVQQNNACIPITFLGIAPSGIFYSVDEAHTISALNPTTQEYPTHTTYTIPLQLRKEKGSYFVVGNKLARYYKPENTITFYNKAMKKYIIETNLLKTVLFHHNPCINTKNKLLYFVKQFEGPPPAFLRHNLICFDAYFMKERWHYPLHYVLQTPPCISADGKKLYLLAGHKLITLNTDRHLNYETRKIKEVIIRKKHGFHSHIFPISQLAITPDENTLYGLDTDNKKLYKINRENGFIKKHFYKIPQHYYYDYTLLGTSQDGKPILQYKN
jgi:hypothetical protein